MEAHFAISSLGAIAPQGEADLAALFAALAAGDADALADLYARIGAEIFGLALWRTGSRDDAAERLDDRGLRPAGEC